MNVSQQPFTPAPHGTVNIAATSTSASIQFQTVEDANECVRLFNAGPNTVFVEFDSSPVTATTTNSMPIPNGGVAIIGSPQQYVAAVCAATNTATLYITPGNGVS